MTEPVVIPPADPVVPPVDSNVPPVVPMNTPPADKVPTAEEIMDSYLYLMSAESKDINGKIINCRKS